MAAAQQILDLGTGACERRLDRRPHPLLPRLPIYHDEPDKVGVESGVTTVIDAGSTGADDVDDFQRLAAGCKTRVHALLNISRIGLLRQNELADSRDLDMDLARRPLPATPASSSASRRG